MWDKTISPSDRLTVHRYNATRKETVLCRAMRKHGVDRFEMIIIETTTHQEADDREIDWIRRLDCIAPKGYNISPGGGKIIFTEDMKKAISERRTGSKASDETKAKMSLAHKGKTAWNLGLRATQILQYNLDGSFVKAHLTPQDALLYVTGILYSGKELESKFHNIGACINGANGQKTAYEFLWRSLPAGDQIIEMIDVPEYKFFPSYMQNLVPHVELKQLILKAKKLSLSKDDYPHCGIHNSDPTIPLSDKLQEISSVKWCADNQYYRDTRNPKIVLYKKQIVKRLKGMTSWTGYLKSGCIEALSECHETFCQVSAA